MQSQQVKAVHHISIPRMINFQGFPFNYRHHGLLFEYNDGRREVIHYSGDASNMDGEVQVTTLQGFLKGAPESNIIYNRDDEHPEPLKRFDADVIMERAKKRLGERQYNLMMNNCEHFAHDCLYGKSFSRQVDMVMSLFGAFMQQGFASNLATASSTTQPSSTTLRSELPDTEEAD
ncbi:uncharacterized protein ACA1_100530 [Acanthamoeba castellanii str. Neff]|jgi:hypothetical protein|uniref:phospholipase A2 n=1 Tax=Acanthamoeba castellanii (strain ATCC 30010 / Neff) TaxID=1257118 RepID=L8GLY2_ACACF|nr:uncharacterized protein ACA1_100530 [Acanthamoeba castellanii str. Neff]ELR13216.1 hypothetical protein ACA1_100530 [Acanthamoeba castellanii str. Neff]